MRLSIVPRGMGTRAHLRTVLFAAVLLTLSAAPPAVAGSELSETEMASLEAGRPVVREENVDRAGHHYIGGVSYVGRWDST